MYSDKENVNSLTAQLINANIRDIVVCPGSRNAVLVHNFYEAAISDSTFRLHPVTDERSAAFYAIGIWLATRNPVAVCVTSGTALLNTLPAVAEAYYRQIPLVIISADRPPQWINQLDGQTLPQYDALYPYANCIQMSESPSTVTVPVYNPLMPLHINVPISEPLFKFITPRLTQPEYSYFEQWPLYDNGIQELDTIVGLINNSRLPAVIIGQYEGLPIKKLIELDEENKLLLLPEIISNHPHARRTTRIENVKAENLALPDLVIHIGGALVNKWLKIRLREQEELKVIRVDKTDNCPDTFSHLEMKVKYDESCFFETIAPHLKPNGNIQAFKDAVSGDFQLSTIKEIAIQTVWQHIIKSFRSDVPHALFLGNSSTVRAATHVVESGLIPIYCNRGVNGIEGSLSVAAGYSIVYPGDVYVILGDLSFFYDVNALWNTQLGGNLHIVILNDHCGGIFSHLPGLKDTPALDKYIAAKHQCNAEGIAQSYHCEYIKVHNDSQLAMALCKNNDTTTNKPTIIEYDTDLEQD